MLNKQKLLLFSSLIIFLGFITLGYFWFRQTQLQKKALVKDLPVNSLIASVDPKVVFLNCRLMTSQIKKEPHPLTQDIVILRSAECFYNSPDGKIASVMVPLAFFNFKTRQFNALAFNIVETDKPGDGYIDKIVNLATDNRQDPITDLFYTPELFLSAAKFPEFFQSLTTTISPDWDVNFQKTGDPKFLPKTQDGIRFYWATQITYHAL